LGLMGWKPMPLRAAGRGWETRLIHAFQAEIPILAGLCRVRIR
jgi:hypothetical protein